MRQEPPSRAYLHVSLPHWGDEHMNEIHRDIRARRRACRAERSGCPTLRERVLIPAAVHEIISRASRRSHRDMARKLHDAARQQFYGVRNFSSFRFDTKGDGTKTFDRDTTFTATCPNRRRHYQGLHSSGIRLKSDLGLEKIKHSQV